MLRSHLLYWLVIYVQDEERDNDVRGERGKEYLHGRSGRVALPRMKVVLAMVEAFLMFDPALREDRRAGTVRKMVEDILMGVLQLLVEL